MFTLNALSLGLTLSLATTLMATEESSTFVGYSHTYHLVTRGVSDAHPFILCETDRLGAIIYNNSFNKISVGIYLKSNWKTSSAISFHLKYGVTTGYNRIQIYKGEIYEILTPFVSEGVMVTVVPSVEYKYKSFIYAYEQVGDAMSFGIKYKL